MKAMILAAGRGERMRPLTDAQPKPLLKVGGRALIEYHIEALVRAGIRELVVNLAWKGVAIREFLGDGSTYGVKVSYSDEGPDALETGGGIHHALPLLGPDPFWLVSGDVYCDFDYSRRELATGSLAHLILVPNPAHKPGGDFGLRGDIVVSSAEDSYTYSGIALLDPGLFAGATAGKFPLAPLLIDAMERGAVAGEVYRGKWVDVGTPERLRLLDRELERAVGDEC